ncbi:DNA alkylation repair protein [Dehalogenimonas alkenigignens]|uniref:Putative DNA alkylation repair enzyme n=1 Tax=Dehalogenimonas alkenigignens TaxID=1217799 RepID=A0A0W0GJR6_9CHLR|nr:DNA alkylation repair protein [Dehalogenimonas alkenigignens]KTB48807.1 putative DNA alkylation repair enzyme [Dehalogenimonas alkenigignens]PVV84784.1 DNA alkylation repair protein [Dehalogenimonas alkenigignens]
MSLADDIIVHLRSMANPANAAGMARYGIKSDNTLGVSMPVLRTMAKSYRRNHELALALWDSGIHEARILASLVDDPKKVTPEQMDRWTASFDSWDICDQVVSNLWETTPYAFEKAVEWVRREEEFVKRAGFVLMARLVVGARNIPEGARIEVFFAEIEHGAADSRNYVKKAVNWALRQIGKRSFELNRRAIAVAEKISRSHNPAARWVASDALRELRSPAVQARLQARIR